MIAKIFSHWLGLFDLTVTNNILTNPHMVKALLVVWSENIGEGEGCLPKFWVFLAYIT